MNNESHAKFMTLAIEQAKASITEGNGPIGCVIVKDGVVIASGHNEEFLRCDPTAHAEVVVIQKACQVVGTKHLNGCILYSTLQPCAMCTVACIWAQVDCIVYGARRGDVAPRYFAEREISINTLVSDSVRSYIEVIPGVLEDECARLCEWQ